MAIIISIALKKGGSGKTTTTVNLAYTFVKAGKKVLIIDVDSQGNTSTACGISAISAPDPDNGFAAQPSLIDVLSNKNFPIEKAIYKTDFGIDILPSRSDLSQIELNMKLTQLFVLKSRISSIEPLYDIVLVDTPPNDQYMTTAALIASEWVLIPFQAQKFALDGLRDFLKIINEIQQGYNKDLKILGLLPTMVVKNTVIADVVMESVRKKYPEYLLPFIIYTSVAFQNAQLVGVPLPEYEKSHPANGIYIEITNYIRKKVKNYVKET